MCETGTQMSWSLAGLSHALMPSPLLASPRELPPPCMLPLHSAPHLMRMLMPVMLVPLNSRGPSPARSYQYAACKVHGKAAHKCRLCISHVPAALEIAVRMRLQTTARRLRDVTLQCGTGLRLLLRSCPQWSGYCESEACVAGQHASDGDHVQ